MKKIPISVLVAAALGSLPGAQAKPQEAGRSAATPAEVFLQYENSPNWKFAL